MVSRLTLTFEPDLRDALQEMSEADYRPPKEQIRYLVIAEARRRGLLPSKNSKIASVKVATTTTGDFAGINP
jgi:hypothetical protein